MTSRKVFFKNMHQHDQRLAKESKLGKETGVKWQGFSARGGTFYTAIASTEVASEKHGLELLSHLTTEYSSFQTLHEKSGMALPDLIAGARWLVLSCKAVASCNRMGSFAYIRKQHSWEIKK